MKPHETISRYSALTFLLEAELGRCPMSLRDILALTPGNVIKLPRPVGSKIELFVGGALFGRGELLDLSGKPALRFSGFSRKKETAPGEHAKRGQQVDGV